MMRKLSDSFMDLLQHGYLSELTERIRNDSDLDLEIRDKYLNIYYKGNSLLRLSEDKHKKYKVSIHKKFLEGLDIPSYLNDQEASQIFIKNIPMLKQNIIDYGKHSIEIEYEQMIIRANNYEPKNNTEYFIIDRQYKVEEGRFDLVGIFWDSHHRMKKQEVPLCLMEVKFSLNQDISKVHEQLERYYEAIKPRALSIAEEYEKIFQQKLELGLYKQPLDRVEALKTLTISKSISSFQFILVLVDYNQKSKKLQLEKLNSLSFANQIRIFKGGFGLWKGNVKPLSYYHIK